MSKAQETIKDDWAYFLKDWNRPFRNKKYSNIKLKINTGTNQLPSSSWREN